MQQVVEKRTLQAYFAAQQKFRACNHENEKLHLSRHATPAKPTLAKQLCAIFCSAQDPVARAPKSATQPPGTL